MTGLVGLTFTENANPPATFRWAFAPGTKLLDAACKPVTVAQLVAAAAAPGDKSAIFYVYMDGQQKPIAPPKMQFWNRVEGQPTDCTPEESPASPAT